MPIPKVPDRLSSNQILGAFNQDAYRKLLPSLEPVEARLGEVICEAGGRLDHAYFPEGCVLSLLTVMENGAEIECANIGPEGAFGLFAAMYHGTSITRCMVQLSGPMLRCDISHLREIFHSDPDIRGLFVSYSETILSQIAQTAGCNALHSIEQRMCRWLLMMHDRAKGDDLTYTHEFLARVMGANRGFINYTRGHMQILDRAGMQTVACECYDVVKARFAEFRPPPGASNQSAGRLRGR